MNIATIKVSGVKAVTNDYPTIPAGIVGATVTFEFTDPAWDGLSKTAVFRGCVTRDVLMTGNVVRIPAETVAQACPFLFVGIYGTDAADNLVIPTLWLSLGTVRDAADPSGDPGTDPDLPIWAQLQDRVEALEAGAPSDPDSPGTPVRPGADGGYYTPAVTQPSSDTVEFTFSPSKPDMPAVDPVQVKLPVGQGSGGNVDFVVDNNPPEDTSVLWVDPDDNDDDGFQEAVNAALAQAKESGEFDGEDGAPGTDGKDYVLTDADKTEIAEMAAELVDVPENSGGGISVTGATVGQTVKISEVDENGVPTAWEPVDFPEGGGGSGSTSNLLAKYVHSGNKEVHPTALDLATGVFTCEGHGLQTGGAAIVVPHSSEAYIPFELVTTLRSSITCASVRVIDNDSFVLTYGNSDITYPSENNTTIDLSEWHIEVDTMRAFKIEGFSAECIDVYIDGHYWGTNNYVFAVYPLSDGKVLQTKFGEDNLYIRLGVPNQSTVCPYITGKVSFGKTYNADTKSTCPSNNKANYEYIQKYKNAGTWGGNRIGQKHCLDILELKEHSEITGIRLCNYDKNKGTVLANGFIVEVYRRG